MIPLAIDTEPPVRTSPYELPPDSATLPRLALSVTVDNLLVINAARN